ncbi:response regulator transcription factor [Bifidobacterium choloepi]|uniref:Sensory transduction protein RegX3 n=1 Tax=Bifidobacterium choloepi TaxID=2614131 RepID=A0A6I5NHA6_9BIFI|nr:response regulator transcription factor [Bifidobacterium choloepi]NEG69693.1 response regulator transcription factor [Bifidobacterium choloepi]
MTRILIVEDEESYRVPLAYQLAREGYDVSSAASGEEGWEKFLAGGVDLVLLDRMMPGIDGIELTRRIREQSRVPIIMVTAKSAEIDTVVGLETGADDYVAKPYSFHELNARIRAVLRRRVNEIEDARTAGGMEAGATGRSAANGNLPLACGPVEMDVDAHQVRVGGEEVFFPLKEFEVLEYLLRNRGRVMTRQQLIDHVWGADYVGDTKTLDVHVKRIRAKIEDDPKNPKLLTTVRGLGYKLG